MLVLTVHTWDSSQSTDKSISPMLTLEVDLCTCSTVMMAGGLIRLTECLLTKLDMFSMLVTNILAAIATVIMAKALALLGTATVFHVLALRSAASWTEMSLPCAATQGNSWDGAKTQTS